MHDFCRVSSLEASSSSVNSDLQPPPTHLPNKECHRDEVKGEGGEVKEEVRGEVREEVREEVKGEREEVKGEREEVKEEVKEEVEGGTGEVKGEKGDGRGIEHQDSSIVFASVPSKMCSSSVDTTAPVDISFLGQRMFDSPASPHASPPSKLQQPGKDDPPSVVSTAVEGTDGGRVEKEGEAEGERGKVSAVGTVSLSGTQDSVVKESEVAPANIDTLTDQISQLSIAGDEQKRQAVLLLHVCSVAARAEYLASFPGSPPCNRVARSNIVQSPQ